DRLRAVDRRLDRLAQLRGLRFGRIVGRHRLRPRTRGGPKRQQRGAGRCDRKPGIRHGGLRWLLRGPALCYAPPTPERAMDRNRWRLDGQLALVTGGSAGIGLAIARELLGFGARVLITARNGDLLERARDELA